MRNRSIRFRLTIWYSLALSAGLIVFGLATWVSMRHSLLIDLNRTLTAQVRNTCTFINAELARPGVHLDQELSEYAEGFGRRTYLRVRNDEGVVIFTSNPRFPWGNPKRQGSHRVPWNGHVYLVSAENGVVNGRAWRFELSASLDTAESLLARLRLLLLTLLPPVIAVAVLGGAWLSRRALKPVDELTAAARSIGLDNLSGRLSVPPTGDELQRLAETWNSMLSRLEQSVERLSRFTADASHELRTAATVIRTTAELATRRDRSGESYRQAFGQIVKESERMTRLLDDLLLLARFDSEAVEIPKSPFDLAALVEELCIQMEPIAESKDLRLSLKLPETSMMVIGNEASLRRMILILLDNAIKFSRRGGNVRLSLAHEERRIVIQVSDSGPGVDERNMQRIFERFYRGPQVENSLHEGNGLGLSLAAAIAKRHAAQISVAQSSRNGSTFCVVIPAELLTANRSSSILVDSQQE